MMLGRASVHSSAAVTAAVKCVDIVQRLKAIAVFLKCTLDSKNAQLQSWPSLSLVGNKERNGLCSPAAILVFLDAI